MQPFLSEHRPLILKHARAFVRAHGEKIAAEDVARELELVLSQLGDQKGAKAEQIESPDAYLRSIVLHAARRAKRRRTLIEQIAAGDDLHAITDDLEALDSDLPETPAPLTKDAVSARQTLDAVIAKLTPNNALIFALLFEDDGSADDVARTLGIGVEDVEAARHVALRAAEELEIEGDSDRRAAGTSAAERREKKLRQLGRAAGAAATEGSHVDEPLLALIRGGDHSDDLSDALLHLAACPDCRARLTEGEIERRAVVVMAIEAPQGSHQDLARATEKASGRLFERGNGRWTAVVAAEKSESLVQELHAEDSKLVSRVGVAEPVEVPGFPSARSPTPSAVDPVEAGTDVAEVQAWAQAAKTAKRDVGGAGAGWTAFATAAVLAAMVIAYVLATR